MRKFLLVAAIFSLCSLFANAQDYYLVGDFNSWNQSANKFEPVEGHQNLFVVKGVTLEAKKGFKPFDGIDWSKGFGSNDSKIQPEQSYTTAGMNHGDNIIVGKTGTYDVYLTAYNDNILVIYLDDPSVKPVVPTLYFRGDVNNWGNSDKGQLDLNLLEDWKFVEDPYKEGIYTLDNKNIGQNILRMGSRFKISTSDWNANFNFGMKYGGLHFVPGVAVEMYNNGDSRDLLQDRDLNWESMTFDYTTPISPKLTIQGSYADGTTQTLYAFVSNDGSFDLTKGIEMKYKKIENQDFGFYEAQGIAKDATEQFYFLMGSKPVDKKEGVQNWDEFNKRRIEPVADDANWLIIPGLNKPEDAASARWGFKANGGKVFEVNVKDYPSDFGYNLYFVPVTSGVAVQYCKPEGDTSGVEEIAADATINAQTGAVVVNAENALAQVYTVAGQLVDARQVAGEATIELPAGFYIVKVADTVKKVIVK